MERRCWVNFQCRGVLLVWMIVGQGPIALALGAGGGGGAYCKGCEEKRELIDERKNVQTTPNRTYGPLRQYFSLYRAVSQRMGERKEN